MSNRTPAPKPNRPRDPAAPPKPRRARDELGRPLPWGEPGRLEMADFDTLSPQENHRLAIRYFDERRFFQAHEAWETCWKQSKATPDEEFFKGLSQLGAGYTHYLRGNPHGTFTLLRRAAGRIAAYQSPHRRVHTDALAATAFAQADAMERAFRAGRPAPPLEFPTI